MLSKCLDTPLVTMGTVWCHSLGFPVWDNEKKDHGRDNDQTLKAWRVLENINRIYRGSQLLKEQDKEDSSS